MHLASACALAGTLAACGTPQTASVAGGEAHALKGPDFVVKGATDFDQKWIDETTEAGIAALGWKRPAPRPQEWDRPLARAVPPAPPAAAPAPAKKKSVLRRFLDRVRQKPAA
jgi:hypothetical protein